MFAMPAVIGYGNPASGELLAEGQQPQSRGTPSWVIDLRNPSTNRRTRNRPRPPMPRGKSNKPSRRSNWAPRTGNPVLLERVSAPPPFRSGGARVDRGAAAGFCFPFDGCLCPRVPGGVHRFQPVNARRVAPSSERSTERLARSAIAARPGPRERPMNEIQRATSNTTTESNIITCRPLRRTADEDCHLTVAPGSSRTSKLRRQDPCAAEFIFGAEPSLR